MSTVSHSSDKPEEEEQDEDDEETQRGSTAWLCRLCPSQVASALGSDAAVFAWRKHKDLYLLGSMAMLALQACVLACGSHGGGDPCGELRRPPPATVVVGEGRWLTGPEIRFCDGKGALKMDDELAITRYHNCTPLTETDIDPGDADGADIGKANCGTKCTYDLCATECLANTKCYGFSLVTGDVADQGMCALKTKKVLDKSKWCGVGPLCGAHCPNPGCPYAKAHTSGICRGEVKPPSPPRSSNCTMVPDTDFDPNNGADIGHPPCNADSTCSFELCATGCLAHPSCFAFSLADCYSNQESCGCTFKAAAALNSSLWCGVPPVSKCGAHCPNPGCPYAKGHTGGVCRLDPISPVPEPEPEPEPIPQPTPQPTPQPVPQPAPRVTTRVLAEFVAGAAICFCLGWLLPSPLGLDGRARVFASCCCQSSEPWQEQDEPIYRPKLQSPNAWRQPLVCAADSWRCSIRIRSNDPDLLLCCSSSCVVWQ
jgi:hypothetical protein